MRAVRARTVLGATVATALLLCVPGQTQGAGTRHARLDHAARSGGGEWRFVRTRGKTRCAHGGRFGFWTRLADLRKLLVYFEGGGGCFSYETCAPGSRWFDPVVNEEDDPVHFGGIFELTNPDNPFRGWSMVMIPSCTGDVFVGSTDHTYREGRKSVTIHHRGWFNGEAAVRWAFRHVPRPERVLVTGTSAGSVGSAFHAPGIVDRYGAVRTSQLGDSLAFVFPRPLRLTQYHGLDHLPAWMRGDARLRPGRFTMVRFLSRLIAHYPKATFSRFNFRADHVQTDFYEQDGGRRSGFTPALLRAERRLHSLAPPYRSFLACGSRHGILTVHPFFDLRVGRVRLRDWTARIANGQPVSSYACRP
jgi:hypothetical protein